MRTPISKDLEASDWRLHRFGLSHQRWASLRGRTYLVTGAGTGYGRALTCALIAAGADVIACSRRQEMGAAVQEELGKLSIEDYSLQYHQLDLTSEQSIHELCAHLMREGLMLHGVLHSAALPSKKGSGAPLFDSTWQEWRATMETNVMGAWYLTKTMWPLLARSEQPRVVLFSSEAGWSGNAGQGVYNVSKAAVNGLGHSLAHEFAARNPGLDIQINTLVPGEARTEMNYLSNKSPYNIVNMALLLLTNDIGGPNGYFFHMDGRHLGFGFTQPYERELQ